MIIYAEIKNPDEMMKKVKRAEALLKELSEIFGWNFKNQLEITIDGQCIEQNATDHLSVTESVSDS